MDFVVKGNSSIQYCINLLSLKSTNNSTSTSNSISTLSIEKIYRKTNQKTLPMPQPPCIQTTKTMKKIQARKILKPMQKTSLIYTVSLQW